MSEPYLIQADCIEAMASLEPGSVDLVLCDPPYGTTASAWDTVIPLDQMWSALNRVKAPMAAAVFTAAQPFSSALTVSNIEKFAHQWVWVKTRITGVLNAKKMPVRKHEQVIVFCEKKCTPTYNPQGLTRKGTVTKQGGQSGNYGVRSAKPYLQEFTNYPRDVLEIASEGKTVHPTQKPVALMEYLIRTYSNPGDTVLDFTMGSGTTGVACARTGRRFIGIENNPQHFATAKQRIADAQPAARSIEDLLS